MSTKSLVAKFKGLKAMQKRAIYLIVLFIVVVLGAWLIKAGVDDGYFAHVQQMIANLNIFKAGITLNADKNNQEDLNVTDTGNTDTNTGTDKTNDTNNWVSAAAPQPVEAEPLTREARIAKMVEFAKIADREVKKLAQIEQIVQKINVISENLKEAQKEATGADVQALSSMQNQMVKVQAQTDAINQQVLLNISTALNQIQVQVDALVKQQGPSAL